MLIKRQRMSGFGLLILGGMGGLMLSAGLGMGRPAIGEATTAAAAAAPLETAAGAVRLAPMGLPSFADLAEAVLPAVVRIDAATIERADARRRPGSQGQGQDPFEFFFGPRRRGQPAPDGEEGSPRTPEEYRSDSGGSGFLISADGLVVTNNHVIDGATKVQVRIGDRDYPAVVKGFDAATDLALLKVEAGRRLPFLDLGDSDRLRVGDWVMAAGSPLMLDQTVTTGVVSAKNRQIGLNDRSFESYIQTDAAINRGNSGGPLVNLAGQVVGIATAMNWGAENIGFAVPINTLKSILSQLRDSGRVRRGYLGINVAALSSDRAEAFGLASAHGVLVENVDPDTPAAKAGVRHGDVILSVDGRELAETRDLIDYVSGKGPGARVQLLVVRDGARRSLDVTLGERPGGDQAADEADEPEDDAGVEWMGLEVQDLTTSVRRNHNIDDAVRGVWVADVKASSPLFEENIRPGDVITEVNGAAVSDAAAFQAAVRGAKTGTLLRLYILRPNPQGGRGVSFFAIVRVP
jgi:serine protease Do